MLSETIVSKVRLGSEDLQEVYSTELGQSDKNTMLLSLDKKGYEGQMRTATKAEQAN